MGQPIGYRVPYEVRVLGQDLESGKQVGNTYFLRSGLAGTGTPAYDSAISGSDIDVVATNFDNRWGAQLLPVLSVNYQFNGVLVRKITGWKYASPFFPIVAVSPLLTGTSFAVAGVLPFSTPQLVSISEITGATNANGIWTATPTGTNTFTTTADTSLQVYTGGGKMQQVSGSLSWLYTDEKLQADSDQGSVAGEALPLFATVSGRRLGSTAGKPWQGRNSYGPLSESQGENGKLSAGALAAWQAALTALIASMNNGAALGDDRDKMFFYNLSFKTALTQNTPFISGSVFTSLVSSCFPQPNLGSMVKRKPRLTGVLP